MKSFPAVFALSLATASLLSSCSSPSASPAGSNATKPAAAPVAPSAKPASPTFAPPPVTVAAPPVTETSSAAAVIVELAPPKLSAEAAAVVERLTNAATDSDTLPHELAASTGFPAAIASLEPGVRPPSIESSEALDQPPPRGLTADGTHTELVERDWTGIVLVPVHTALSKAYTSDVRLLKIEAHPLNDGRVRIWARVHNVSRSPLPAEVACSFRMHGDTAPQSPYFYNLDVPASSYRDVFFVTPDGELTAYTVLVRSVEALKR